MTKIVAISDIHGFLPDDGVIPECDILLIAGDHCPMWDHNKGIQEYWLRNDYSDWLERQPAKNIVGIAGNHDFALEGHKQTFGYTLPWIYLNNEDVTIEGLKIWGSPLSNRYGNWANMKPEPALSDVWKTIPRDIDILMTHGPAYGHGDIAPDKYGATPNTHVGSPSLSNQLMYDEWPNLKLHIWGHIHPGYGEYSIKNFKGANAARCNDDMKPVNPPLEFEL